MVQYIVVCAAFVAVFCLPSSEGTAYHIYIEDKVGHKDGCTRLVKIDGNGIKTHFPTSCEAEVNRESLLNGILVIGDYTKHRASVFSDMPSSLVVIHGDGDQKCFSRTYSEDGPETEVLLSKWNCKKYKKKMSAEWTGSNKKSSQENDMYVITTFQKSTEDSKCTGTMELRRRKLKYVEKYDDCRPRRVVFVADGAIIGDYRSEDGVSRVSYNVDTMVSVYLDKICEKKIFKNNVDGLVEDSTLEGEDCETYKRRVIYWMDQSKE